MLNPVRARMVHEPADWPWTSDRAMVGMADSPSWLKTDALLTRFSDQIGKARERYARFVAEGMGAASPGGHLKGQIYLGDDELVKRMQANTETVQIDVNIPKPSDNADRRTSLELNILPVNTLILAAGEDITHTKKSWISSAKGRIVHKGPKIASFKISRGVGSQAPFLWTLDALA